ncbi:protein-disulfide isomerase [Longilinea arvoryzae]|uniref:Protein-disulfide isomerase n=1 Tax=Longilinea arvoryzae TaxID=360412 RepID=A0A0S7BFY9_9CHLR|nr:thioredoxin domain-containing protein [Longilinea arvoryzae]GAP12930.1 protein-disulfide isomerase [Longilinea arvoryzae]
MSEENNLTEIEKSARQRTSLVWVVVMLLGFGLGLGTGFLVWGKQAAPAKADPVQAAVIEPTATQPLTRYTIPTDGEPALGPDDAPITLVAFSDFECPYCQKWYAETWPQIQKNYGDQVRLVYRDFPLPMHANAQPAAEAAACAFEQGKYWEFQDLIFNSGEALGDSTYQDFAQQLGLDVDAFKTCYEGGRYRDEVEADRDWASELGVSSTPTFFVNGIALVGAQPYETFQQVIDMELAGGLK